MNIYFRLIPLLYTLHQFIHFHLLSVELVLTKTLFNSQYCITVANSEAAVVATAAALNHFQVRDLYCASGAHKPSQKTSEVVW